MSRPIDLMPAVCRDALNRRRMIRRWTLVYLLSATTLFGTHWFLSLANRSMADRRDALALKMKITWSRNEVVNRLLAEISEVEAMVTRYNRLAWPVRATEAIDAIASVTPPSVTLSELSITPREEKPASRSSSKEKTRKSAEPEAPEAPRPIMVIEMEGVANDDAAVASLVSGLDGHALFSRVTVDFTRAKPLEGREVRNFRVTCEVDLSLRYQFVSADAAPNPGGTP
jgi:hypothetical protein